MSSVKTLEEIQAIEQANVNAEIGLSNQRLDFPIDNNLPTNGQHLISAEDLRSTLHTMVEYAPFIIGDREDGLSVKSYIHTASTDTTNLNKAYGKYSVVEGYNNITGEISSSTDEIDENYGFCAHAEGSQNIASGNASHVEGSQNTAANDCSHAEGFKTIASAPHSHAEGYKSKAEGYGSHAEGGYLFDNNDLPGGNAKAYASHAEGINTFANGPASHAEGLGTKTSNLGEHASGKYNVSTEGQTIFSVGIGDSDESRLNALEIKNSGKTIIGNPENYTEYYNTSNLLVEGDVFVDGDIITKGKHIVIEVTTEQQNELEVNGQSNLNGTLNVDGDTTLNAKLDVDGDTTLNAKLDVDGDTTLNAKLDVDGDTTLNSKLDVTGSTTLGDTLNVTGDTTLNANVYLPENTYINGNSNDNKVLNIIDNKITERVGVERNVFIDSDYNSAQQTDSVDKELYYGNYALTGPLPGSTSNNAVYSINTEAWSFIQNIINYAETVNFNINGAKLISYDEINKTVTFDNYIDFYWYNGIQQPKQIVNKYFTFKYYTAANPISPINTDDIISETDEDVETFDFDGNSLELKDIFNPNIKNGNILLASAEGIQSIATNIGLSKGFLSSSSNNSVSVGEYSSSEGLVVLSTKVGKYYNSLNTGITKNPQGLNGSYGLSSHTEGAMNITTQSGMFGHAEGHSTVSDNFAAHSEGRKTYSGGLASHAEGSGSIAIGYGSHAEGISSKEYHELFGNKTNGGLSLDEILDKWVQGTKFSMAIGDASHVSGKDNIVNGNYSFVGGEESIVTGNNSFAFGQNNILNGNKSIILGSNNELTIRKNETDLPAILIGTGLTSNTNGQIVLGKYNEASSSGFVFGNGTSANERKTIFTVSNAAINFYGGDGSSKTPILYVSNKKIEYNSKALATQEWVENNANIRLNYITENTTTGAESVSINAPLYLQGLEQDLVSTLLETEEITTNALINLENRISALNGSTSSSGSSTFSLITEDTENNEVSINGSIYADAFYEKSDERLKTFKDEIPVDFDKLKLLRKAYFSFNRTLDKNEIGVSAQEIQAIYPEIVNEDSNGYLSVDYGKLSVIALKAIDILDDRLTKIEKHLGL